MCVCVCHYLSVCELWGSHSRPHPSLPLLTFHSVKVSPSPPSF